MFKSRKSKQPNRSSEPAENVEVPIFELLEPRLLYSADALGAAAVLLPDDSFELHNNFVNLTDNEVASNNNDQNPNSENESGNPSEDPTTHPRELVFIDSRVPDAQAFVNAWANPNVQFVIISENQDAISVIEESLTSFSENGDVFETVKIVSHGSSGSLLLGNTSITENTLLDNADSLSRWSNGLSDTADILLFGCNVGEGDAGISFLTTLSNLTQADIAASDDATGNATSNGDWELEVSIGATQTIDFVDDTSFADWKYTLAEIVVTHRADDVAFANTITISDLSSLPAVTLHAAITAANNAPGDDVIVL